MAWLRGLGAMLVALAGLVLLSPAPAWACSCAPPPTGAEEFTTSADVVIVGTITHREPPPEPVSSTLDPATYTVAVSRVMRGEAGPTTWVLSAMSGASCGLEGIELGEEYVVFADREGGELWANGCGGTQLATPGFVADVEAVTGPGEPVVQPVPVVDEPGSAGNLAGDDLVDGSTVPWWAIYAAGLGLVVGVSVVTLLVVGSRRA
ncbi:MAG: hypothetical protein ACRDOM_06460 [Nocardioides sp.]